MIKIGVINVSDRASKGIYEDIPGKAIVSTLKEYLTSPFETVYAVIPDEQDQIEAKLIEMAESEACCLIVTCGGTGPALRDVTPEATEAVCEKMVPGPRDWWFEHVEQPCLLITCNFRTVADYV